MLSDLSVVAISLSVILLCWVVVRLNQKLEEAMFNLKNSKDLDPIEEIEGDGSPVSGQKLGATRQ